ncbi:Rrf2 family transcriptional regulator [Streptomyces sp. PSRA5]|uniref:Rrf2 family transcriptional regulator n=1 Tax=Streptomyces panacea TaxID=3035064 RepID=UPI00339D03CF
MRPDGRGSDNAVVPSQRIATSVNANPVVIRRCLGQLKDGGLVTVTHGRHGGWSLARAATDITLLDIYQSLPDERVFGMPASTPDAECDVGAGIQSALSDVYQEATDALCRSLRDTSLAGMPRKTMASHTATARAN